MKTFQKLVSVGLIVLLSVLIVLGCGNGNTQNAQGSSNAGGAKAGETSPAKAKIDFFATPQGGSWYPLAVAIGKLWQDKTGGKVETVTVKPGGGVSNVQAINEKQGQIGLAHSMNVIQGINGQPPFNKKMDNVSQMAALYPYYLNIITLKQTGIKTIADLKGKRVEIGPKGNTSEKMAIDVLKTVNLTLDDLKSAERLGFTDAVEQLKDGHLDAIIRACPYPYALWYDLGQTKDMVMLDIPDEIIDKMLKNEKGYLRGKIPANTYPKVDYDVNTIYTTTTMIVGKNVSEDLVYAMTKALYENFADVQAVDKSAEAMKKEDLAKDLNIELHPGALRFWKEAKLR